MNAAVTEIRPLPLAALVLSGTEAQEERRGRFDQAALKELARSLSTTGQINPIVVRQHPKDVRKFEIVAGERRFVAAAAYGVDVKKIRAELVKAKAPKKKGAKAPARKK